MKEIFVYLEGQSDQIGMRRLLSHPIDCATAKGNRTEFYFMGGKKSLLNNGHKKAINILRNKPNSCVVGFFWSLTSIHKIYLLRIQPMKN